MAKYSFYMFDENGRDVLTNYETELLSFFRSIGIASEDDITIQDIFSKSFNWTSARSDMVSLSYSYPTAIFGLFCEEDKKENSWRCFYQNGYIDFCPVLFGYEYPKTQFGAIVYSFFPGWY